MHQNDDRWPGRGARQGKAVSCAHAEAIGAPTAVHRSLLCQITTEVSRGLAPRDLDSVSTVLEPEPALNFVEIQPLNRTRSFLLIQRKVTGGRSDHRDLQILHRDAFRSKKTKGANQRVDTRRTYGEVVRNKIVRDVQHSGIKLRSRLQRCVGHKIGMTLERKSGPMMFKWKVLKFG